MHGMNAIAYGRSPYCLNITDLARRRDAPLAIPTRERQFVGGERYPVEEVHVDLGVQI
jgi:hypothetical protein